MAGPYRQQVPRPPSIVPGDTPPWHSRVRERTHPITLEDIRKVLSGAPAPINTVVPISAVLAPLVDRGGEINLVLIRRAWTLQRDPGHIAFPGGRIEPGETPLEAALREANEEIGLLPTAVDFAADLPTIEHNSDRQIVAPFVGLIEGPAELTPSAGEVDAILEIPLAGIMADGIGWEEQWELGGRSRRIRFFASPSLLGDDLIWGLTASILWEFFDCITAL